MNDDLSGRTDAGLMDVATEEVQAARRLRLEGRLSAVDRERAIRRLRAIAAAFRDDMLRGPVALLADELEPDHSNPAVELEDGTEAAASAEAIAASAWDPALSGHARRRRIAAALAALDVLRPLNPADRIAVALARNELLRLRATTGD